jgi:hypothetical protein
MRTLQLALIYANWAGSVFFGWLHAPLWLLVPVCAWASFAFGATAAISKHQVEIGVKDSRYARMMLLPNIKLIAHNAGINFLLFGAGWIASLIAGKLA